MTALSNTPFDRDVALHELAELLTASCGVSKDLVKPEARFKEDLEMDSVDGIELVFAIEEKYHVGVSDEQMNALSTVAEALDLVEELLSRKPSEQVSGAAADTHAETPAATRSESGPAA